MPLTKLTAFLYIRRLKEQVLLASFRTSKLISLNQSFLGRASLKG